MLNLLDITYLSVIPNRTANPAQHINSILNIGLNSSRNIKFGRKVIYTVEEPTINPQDFEIKIIKEVPYENFNDFVFDFYPEAFDTKFMINFHGDGFIQNVEAWDNKFLDYDFIGAPIGIHNMFLVGNGGFSLRSQFFCQEVKKLKHSGFYPDFLPHVSLLPKYYTNEDVLCSLFFKDALAEKGIKIPSLQTASEFSTEHLCVLDNNRASFKLQDFQNSFGMHEIKTLRNLEVKYYRYELQKRMLANYSNDN